ncbi:hypothetical protein EWM64_g7801, partial [Hericium alpestre]
MLASKSSLTDLKDWVIDDGPAPPLQSRQTSKLEDLIASRQDEYTNGEKSNGPSPSFKTKSPPPRPPTGSKRVLPPHISHSSSPSPRPSFSAPLINFDSPQANPWGKPGNAPPLPPRKMSTSSLRSASTPSLSPIVPSTSGKGKDLPSPLLKPPDADHTYPPNVSKLSLNTARGHAPASSISSFHSVSLSSDGGGDHDRLASISMQTPVDDKDKEWTDGDSLDESFENVSTSSFVPSLSITQYMQGFATYLLADPHADPLHFFRDDLDYHRLAPSSSPTATSYTRLAQPACIRSDIAQLYNFCIDVTALA